MARLEYEHKSTGLKAKAAELAANGKEHGGIRHYGYTRQRDALGNIVKGSPRVIVPGEAEVIREPGRQTGRGGLPVRASSAELKRSRGAGPRWPALALRGHPAGAHLSRSGRPPPAPRGDCRGGRVGADPGAANVWEAVCRHLHDPGSEAGSARQRAYLLTGLVVTTDGAKMVGRGAQLHKGVPGETTRRCYSGRSVKGGGCTIDAGRLEGLVEAVVLDSVRHQCLAGRGRRG